ncbi:MAG: hypothetical protein WAN82_01035 [Candidatus Bathyarchaeia archaeon]
MSLPNFPEKMEGSLFFREIMPQFLPEYSPFKLALLGLIVEKKGKTKIYEALRHSLRKIQWVKLIGLKAIYLEEEISKAVEPNTLVFDPLRQTVHSLCITDCLIHTKSALDSMAVFLTDLLGLDQKAGDRDFKKLGFRQSVCQKDAYLKYEIKKLEPWFLELQEVRDEWIHIKAIESLSVHGKSDVGMLPIPRNISLSAEEQRKISLNSKNFWSTKDFVEHHYSQLAELFREIVDRSLQIEHLDLTEPVTVPEHFMSNLTMFPTHSTENMVIQKMKVHIPKSLVDW